MAMSCATQLKAEYRGRTLYDCGGQNLPHAWAQPSCTAVPPGGLQEKVHLQVRSLCMLCWMVANILLG